MESLKLKRKTLRTAFTRLFNELEGIVKTVDNPAEDLDCMATFQMLGEKNNKLSQLNEEILGFLLSDSEEEEIEKEMRSADEYSHKYKKMCLFFERKTNSAVDADSLSSIGSCKRKFKLPRLELKKFSGEIKDWLPFWGQFKKIDEDSDIDEADKFQYLVQATIPNSRARELVESFPPSSGNYCKAIDCLKSRFGRDDLLVEYYVRELLKLTLAFNLKDKQVKLSTIYDRLETQLRSLETLGVTTAKYAAMLFPLVESCLSEEVLRAWQRNDGGRATTGNDAEKESRLESLMTFLKNEVENEDRITLAMQGFSLKETNKNNKIKKDFPTAAVLFTGHQNSVLKCVFCEKKNSHESKDCFVAKKLDLDEKMQRLKKKGCCFRCLNTGHKSSTCRVRVRCGKCDQLHHVMMCPDGKTVGSSSKQEAEEEKNTEQFNTLANPTCSASVLLQTLVVRIHQGDREKIVRAIIDTGSERTYVTEDVIQFLSYDKCGEVKLIHKLFGGVETKERLHRKYKIKVSSIDKKYKCDILCLDEHVICSYIKQVPQGPWVTELKHKGIKISDFEISSLRVEKEIKLLIGADIAGKLFTGKIERLKSGPVAVETLLGWTLMGKMGENVDVEHPNSLAALSVSLHVSEAKLSDLWKLETIGIADPAESKKKKEMHQDTLEYFRSTLKIDKEGRYEVALPWVLESSRLPDNRQVAEKRLSSVYKKLMESKKISMYTDVFENWIAEDVIEEVEDKEELNVHYLPHRPVFKENSSTKVRPVFDASAHLKGTPSLNDCLETGPNLIELVPSLLDRFRRFPVGITSDIEKAFLQIGILEKDRNYLRFLWNTESEGMKIYRHRRVVFGVTCSPFLLAATLNYHLEQAPEDLLHTAEILKSSFYVDNCVCSLKNTNEANKFILESQMLMSLGKFNLRGWQSNASLQAIDQSEKHVVPLLGLNWNLKEDTLSCNINFPNEEQLILTKRGLLSLAQSIFDPMGIASAVTICPKFMLQESWKLGLKWDDALPEDLSKQFLRWLKSIKNLSEVKIPRWMKLGHAKEENISLHLFCDASAKAYAACIFLRVEVLHEVFVSFVQSRARVSPLKNLTIPRLELLACCIGSRLCASVIENLKLSNIKLFCWTDSLTALSWIKRDAPWGTFVWNRVQEIRTLTNVESWRHVPGTLNPADLPSRGCTAEQFLRLKWWEGPLWLYENKENWPQCTEEPDEELINAEKRKTILSALIHTEKSSDWYYRSFSSHLKNVRVLAWILRFCKHARRNDASNSPTLAVSEIEEAEQVFMLLVQKENFDGPSDPRLHSLNVVADRNGLLRVKTRTVYRQDTEDFRYPVILPGEHPAVEKLIMHKHRSLMHCGIQILMALLREKYWILKGRKSIRKILNRCVPCKRFNAKPVKIDLPPLPEDRVRDANVFEVSGVDMAGPLFLKDGSKTWIAIFTCAVYRAIHLELLSSLSTENFLLALRRFIARRGKPSVMYSDNGTNFVGTSRLLHRIDWGKVDAEGKNKEIVWKFIPPSAPWWGGWWERLIFLVKDLLRKVLGQACINYEELNTILCDCEAIINSRPLTYVSEQDDLEPLTPSSFLRERKENGIPDLNRLDLSSVGLRKRQLYRCKLREDLKSRFRLEYLGLLRQQTKKIRNSYEFKVGEVVIVEVPNQKRLNWPLGKITEIFPGKDGFVRLVRVKTKNGEILRPIQRLYALEVQAPSAENLREKIASDVEEKIRPQRLAEHPEELTEPEGTTVPELDEKTTRLGRRIRAPRRLDL